MAPRSGSPTTPATGEFTVPEDGVYAVKGEVTFRPSAAGTQRSAGHRGERRRRRAGRHPAGASTPSSIRCAGRSFLALLAGDKISHPGLPEHRLATWPPGRARSSSGPTSSRSTPRARPGLPGRTAPPGRPVPPAPRAGPPAPPARPGPTWTWRSSRAPRWAPATSCGSTPTRTTRPGSGPTTCRPSTPATSGAFALGVRSAARALEPVRQDRARVDRLHLRRRHRAGHRQH